MPIDAHNHLQEMTHSVDLEALLCVCEEAGVTLMAVNGTSEEDWPCVLELAERRPWIQAALGLHPWKLHSRSDTWKLQLKKWLEQSNAAVGEIGIDHWKLDKKDSEQEGIFLEQLDLAHELKRPAVIHCIRAWGRLYELLKSYAPNVPLQLHAYSGSAEEIRRFEPLGCYFSFGFTVMHSAREKLRTALKAVPPERLLLETDAPAGALPGSETTAEAIWGAQGNLGKLYSYAAELLNVPVSQLEARCSENAARLFGRF